MANMIGVQAQASPVSRRFRSERTDRALRQALLSIVIEQDVIPALIARARPAASVAGSSAVTWAPMIAELTALALGPSAGETGRFVLAQLAGGHSAEELCLHLLAPVARNLDDGWADESYDFVDVSIGIWRLHDALRLLVPLFRASPSRAVPRRAVLVPLPGAAHTFAMALAAAFFRRSGWEVWSGELSDAAALTAMLRAQHVDLLGLSLAGDDALLPGRALITEARRASRNPGLAVLVGGPSFSNNRQRAQAVGADGIAENPSQAVAAAERLMARQAGRDVGNHLLTVIDNGSG